MGKFIEIPEKMVSRILRAKNKATGNMDHVKNTGTIADILDDLCFNLFRMGAEYGYGQAVADGLLNTVKEEDNGEGNRT